MGTFKVSLGIGDPQGRRYEAVDALVDTGATYTVLPGSFLRDLGVRPQEKYPFELADKRIVELDVGETYVRLDGRTHVTLVVFADEGTEPILGVVTLETFRLAADPVNRRLIPVPGLLKSCYWESPVPTSRDWRGHWGCPPDLTYIPFRERKGIKGMVPMPVWTGRPLRERDCSNNDMRRSP